MCIPSKRLHAAIDNLNMRIERIEAERDALAAQLKEARELAEAWEDYFRESHERGANSGYYLKPDNQPATCPWRGK